MWICVILKILQKPLFVVCYNFMISDLIRPNSNVNGGYLYSIFLKIKLQFMHFVTSLSLRPSLCTILKPCICSFFDELLSMFLALQFFTFKPHILVLLLKLEVWGKPTFFFWITDILGHQEHTLSSHGWMDGCKG